MAECVISVYCGVGRLPMDVTVASSRIKRKGKEWHGIVWCGMEWHGVFRQRGGVAWCVPTCLHREVLQMKAKR